RSSCSPIWWSTCSMHGSIRASASPDGARTMVDLAPLSVATAAAAAESPRSLRGGIIGFCRRQPLGTVGLVVVMVMAVARRSAGGSRPYQPTAHDFAALTATPRLAPP